MKNKISVKMSADQTSTIGYLLYRLYYKSGQLHQLLDLVKCTGYPHNGGEHTLNISGERDDVLAWLELFEQFGDIKIPKLIEAAKTHNSVNGRECHPELFRCFKE